jgi:uncharacterized alpha-E superfamily protein
MLSRAANAIYWMARYLERAENVARIVGVNVHLILDTGLAPSHAQWSPLVTTSGDEVDFAARYDEANEKNVVQFLTFDAQNPNSIFSCICNARENARTVRDVISSEMWEQINVLYHTVMAHSRKRRVGNLEDFYTQIRMGSHLFAGLAENTMSHGEGWHFARLGRMLERADKTARILDVKYFLLLPQAQDVDSPHDVVEWAAVLKSASAFEMYRKHFHQINYRDVADFLIFNKAFPRSIAYCMRAASASLRAIGDELQLEALQVNREMATLRAFLNTQTIQQVMETGLHEFIDQVQFNLNVVDQSIYQGYFNPQR